MDKIWKAPNLTPSHTPSPHLAGTAGAAESRPQLVALLRPRRRAPRRPRAHRRAAAGARDRRPGAAAGRGARARVAALGGQRSGLVGGFLAHLRRRLDQQRLKNPSSTIPVGYPSKALVQVTDLTSLGSPGVWMCLVGCFRDQDDPVWVKGSPLENRDRMVLSIFFFGGCGLKGGF